MGPAAGLAEPGSGAKPLPLVAEPQGLLILIVALKPDQNLGLKNLRYMPSAPPTPVIIYS